MYAEVNKMNDFEKFKRESMELDMIINYFECMKVSFDDMIVSKSMRHGNALTFKVTVPGKSDIINDGEEFSGDRIAQSIKEYISKFFSSFEIKVQYKVDNSREITNAEFSERFRSLQSSL